MKYCFALTLKGPAKKNKNKRTGVVHSSGMREDVSALYSALSKFGVG